MVDSFVCAFRGRRDSYQVPLALAEAALLDQFITDAYSLPWMRRFSRWFPPGLQAKADFRSEPGIPIRQVSCLWGTTLLEHTRHRLGYPPSLTFMKLDRRFSQAASRRAAHQRAHLLLYSPYAWEAFIAKYPHTPRRVLFQYHPHSETESRLLADDGANYPHVGDSFSGQRGLELPEALVRRERDCWQHADLILCASTFTKRSLLAAGADETKCRIVPYGIEVPAVCERRPPEDSFRPIFVGSGGQRKGLHHLLLAWRRASLPAASKLTLVCRVIDREIEQMARATKGVELLRGVPHGSLDSLYASSSLFVMPSLVEGFGQVYLEALAQGCPVLGTANTCLPDLGGEAEGIFLVTPCAVDQLASKLEETATRVVGNTQIRDAARACAARFSWPAFRDGIRQALRDDLEGTANK